MDASDYDKQNQRREAESLRTLAFFGVCLATVATMVCVVTVPLAYQHFQQLGTQMQNEVDFCKLRSGNIWREVTRTQAFAQTTGGVRHVRAAVTGKGRRARQGYGGAAGGGVSGGGGGGAAGGGLAEAVVEEAPAADADSLHPDSQDRPAHRDHPEATDSPEALDNPALMPKHHLGQALARPATQPVSRAKTDRPDLRDRLARTETLAGLVRPQPVADKAHPDRLARPDPTDSPVALESQDSPADPDSSRKARPRQERLAHRARTDSPVALASQDNPAERDSPESKDRLETLERLDRPGTREALAKQANLAKMEATELATIVLHRALLRATEMDTFSATDRRPSIGQNCLGAIITPRIHPLPLCPFIDRLSDDEAKTTATTTTDDHPPPSAPPSHK
ncbi:hypothetical protein niasHS_011703 [Heterodera schachtii]|uniref:Nematode cuticle collagen N-terminal domain-containing protein n=1 Tax=Heterodera schachtii TaxID=97005 RepID=A0ABD2IN03_HETSC